jgi:glycosyltransferase involved in cell wall biosynthesis
MLKVLNLLDSVNRGGAEMQVLDVCRNASRFGIEVTFVAAGGGTLEDEFRESGVEFVRLDRMLPIDIRLASRLRQIIKERDIQIVHGYQAVEGLHLYLATRGLKNVRRVLSFQGFIPGKKNQIAARLIASKMDANISVSKSLLDYLRNDVRIKRLDSFHIIYNGADPERLRPSGRSIKEELALSDDAMLGAMVANFTKDPTKDQLTICRALPAVVEQFPNFHFLFAGRVSEGAERKMSECRDVCDAAGIGANVHFLGPRSDVADILSELDVFVLSSRREGFPVAVSEAMLVGVPLIVSDIEPLREAVRDGALGETFPVGDASVLLEKMMDLLGDPERRTELRQKAQGFARENFSIDAHLRGLKDLYLSLIGK